MTTILQSLAFVLLSVPSVSAIDVVSIQSGRISGAKTPDGVVTIFKGIPFAAPPLGKLRWKAPQPVASWDGVHEYTTFGPSPMQGKPVPSGMWSREFCHPEEPTGEDCLNLNVWTAAKRGDERRPVLVWIYGGGFISGGSATPIYDGEATARKGIVFVSINYRVGVFGFFAHPELTRESGCSASGNYGLMDQVAALRWVRDNISAFGGDPANVTIAGQSAGSMSVNCLVVSPLAKGLFQRAIGESGGNFFRNQISLKQAEEAGVATARFLNASSLAELRSMAAEKLMKANGPKGPIIDGYVLPDQIADLFADGKQNRVDLLTGWNEDEGILLEPIKSAEDYVKKVQQVFGDRAEKCLEYYPASSDAEATVSQYKISRDIIFGVNNYVWANAQAEEGSTHVYVYRFIRKVPGVGQYAKYGAFHTAEVPYAYDNLRIVDRPWQPVDRELAQTMSNYWASFVRTGNPNGPGRPTWPAYELETRQVMFLGDRVKAGPLPDREALDLVASLD